MHPILQRVIDLKPQPAMPFEHIDCPNPNCPKRWKDHDSREMLSCWRTYFIDGRRIHEDEHPEEKIPCDKFPRIPPKPPEGGTPPTAEVRVYKPQSKDRP